MRLLVVFSLFCLPLVALSLGDDAPDFQLYDQEGFPHTLRQHRGRFVLLFFYERDFTPFGIRKVKAFERIYKSLKRKDVVVYGVSNDFSYAHQAFHEKFRLTYDLLSDPEEKVIQLYEADGWLGTKSISYLIGPDGRIFRKYDGAKSYEHCKLALNELKSLPENFTFVSESQLSGFSSLNKPSSPSYIESIWSWLKGESDK